MSLEIDISDVIKLMLQFCKENSLMHTFQALRKEAKVNLNTVDSVSELYSNIVEGRWDVTLKILKEVDIPLDKMIKLYEQVTLELLEMQEYDIAKLFIRDKLSNSILKPQFPLEIARLENLCLMKISDPNSLYKEGETKEKSREELAILITKEVSEVPPSRLLELLGNALKKDKNLSEVTELKTRKGEEISIKYDILTGKIPSILDKADEDQYVQVVHKHIKLGPKSHIKCGKFSPDGIMLATGSVDGFVEIWDPQTGALKSDLEYQMNDLLMIHDKPVLCVNFSKDSKLLCSGDERGIIKIWKIADGKCLRKLEKTHSMGVTSLYFVKDNSQILTSSFDTVIKSTGLKSGTVIKEYKGHTSYINDMLVLPDQTKFITASSDGTVRIWDFKSCKELNLFIPSVTKGSTMETPVNTIDLYINNPDDYETMELLCCTKSDVVYLIDMNGRMKKRYALEEKSITGEEFMNARFSLKGMYIYCVSTSNTLYIFHKESCNLMSVVSLNDKDVIGITQHPQSNLLVSYTVEGDLILWKT